MYYHFEIEINYQKNSVYREKDVIRIKRGLLLLKSAQLLGLTIIVMAVALLMGNGEQIP